MMGRVWEAVGDAQQDVDANAVQEQLPGAWEAPTVWMQAYM